MNYKTWIFDCDGVLLDSNNVKSQAFYEVGLQFGRQAAEAVLHHHVTHGGVSRFKKWERFYTEILGREKDEQAIADLINQYAQKCRAGVLACAETPRLRECLGLLSGKKFVASGGYQQELREVFKERNLDRYFDGIYGSPTPKDEIVRSLPLESAVMVGDSRYDFEAASAAQIDFIFMTSFSEFDGWEDFFRDKNVTIIKNLGDLL